MLSTDRHRGRTALCSLGAAEVGRQDCELEPMGTWWQIDRGGTSDQSECWLEGYLLVSQSDSKPAVDSALLDGDRVSRGVREGRHSLDGSSCWDCRVDEFDPNGDRPQRRPVDRRGSVLMSICTVGVTFP